MAVGGGGGVNISLFALDSTTQLSLATEYGIADAWLTVEARAMKGLNSNLDYTGSVLCAGVTLDY